MTVKNGSKWVILGFSIHGRFIGISRTKPVLSPRARARARARGILKMTHFGVTFNPDQGVLCIISWKKGVQKWVIFDEDALLEMTHFTGRGSLNRGYPGNPGYPGIPRMTHFWVTFWPKIPINRSLNDGQKWVKMGHFGVFHTWPVYRHF